MSWSTLVLALALSAGVEKVAPPATSEPPASPIQAVPAERHGALEALLPSLPELGSEVRTASCTLTQRSSGGSVRWQASGQFRVKVNQKGEVVESTFTPKINSGTTTETTPYVLPGLVRVTVERKTTWEGDTEKPSYSTVSGHLPDEKPFVAVVGRASYNLEVTTETVTTVKFLMWELVGFSQAETMSRMFTIEFENSLDTNWCHARVPGFFEEDWVRGVVDLLDTVTLGLVHLNDDRETLQMTGLWLQIPAGKKAVSRRGRLEGDCVDYDLRWSKE